MHGETTVNLLATSLASHKIYEYDYFGIKKAPKQREIHLSIRSNLLRSDIVHNIEMIDREPMMSAFELTYLLDASVCSSTTTISFHPSFSSSQTNDVQRLRVPLQSCHRSQ